MKSGGSANDQDYNRIETQEIGRSKNLRLQVSI